MRDEGNKMRKFIGVDNCWLCGTNLRTGIHVVEGWPPPTLILLLNFVKIATLLH